MERGNCVVKGWKWGSFVGQQNVEKITKTTTTKTQILKKASSRR